jgi:chorismate mutase
MRAIRGAVCVSANTSEAIAAAVTELVTVLVRENSLAQEEIVSAIFTMTPDLFADFPARFARELGWHDVPMMCAQEIAVPGAMSRVCRLIVHAEGRKAARHVYLRGAETLRPDLSHARAEVVHS